jgi:hypothetical protein
MKAFRILNQFSKGRGQVVRPGAPEAEYVFLAPNVIQESHSHTWSPYESVASRLAQKVRSIATVTAETAALVRAFPSQANVEDAVGNAIRRTKETQIDMQTVENLAARAYSQAPGHNIPKIKIDTPLYYENSERRTFQLDFLLIAEREPFSDIVEPVHNIMRKAAPEFTTELNIDFPYMWEVYTQPQRWFNYTTCVLHGVQPNWGSPYINGYPSNVQLTLSFTDLGPLYRQSIERGTSINVINRDEQRTREENAAVAVVSRNRTAGERGFR